MEKLLEFSQQAGTPIAYIVIVYFAWQLFIIVQKFSERHFQHIDTMEKELQEISKNATENTKQLAQALSALNQSVAAQNQLTAQNISELKPLTAMMARLEQLIEFCKDHNKNINRGEGK